MTCVVIQIPCFNEEDTLAETLKDLPRELPGVTEVLWMLVDDGSTDSSVKIAESKGVDIIVRHRVNRGLAAAYQSGINAALKVGADIIVNTDADNQYFSEDIATLITPIVNNSADVVIGARPISKMDHFSGLKKILQRVGSTVVRAATNLPVEDATSGFRAVHSSAVMELQLFSTFSYTLESLVYFSSQKFRVVSVPIRVREVFRPSRLFKSNSSYIFKNGGTLVRSLITYRPLRFLGICGLMLLLLGSFFVFRFLMNFFGGDGEGQVQSLILASTSIVIGFQFLITGILADLVVVNRKLLSRLSSRIS